MKRLILCIGLVITMSGATLAADIDMETPAVEAMGVDWTGPYLGGHAGWGLADVNGVFDSSDPVDDRVDAEDLEHHGLLGGLQAGYNWQHSGFLWGIEGDLSLTEIDGDSTSDIGGDDRLEYDLNVLASLRLRAGVVLDSLLLHLTGGVSYVNADFDIIDNQGALDENSGNVDYNAFGGVVGAGAALAMSDNWSIRVDGLYYLFNEEEDTSHVTDDSDPGDFLAIDNVFVIRGGIDFHF